MRLWDKYPPRLIRKDEEKDFVYKVAAFVSWLGKSERSRESCGDENKSIHSRGGRLERKLRVGVTAFVFSAALIFGWLFSRDIEWERGSDDDAQAVSHKSAAPDPNDETSARGGVGFVGSAGGRDRKSGVEIPDTAALLGEDLASRFEKGGPFEPKDLPKVGRALKRMEGVIDSLWGGGDEGTSAAAHGRYLELQKKYALIMAMVPHEEGDTEARSRLERYQRERKKLLEQRGEGDASTREGRDRDLARLKRNILRGQGEALESSPGK